MVDKVLDDIGEDMDGRTHFHAHESMSFHMNAGWQDEFVLVRTWNDKNT